jgi:hypothetical protein
MKNQKINHMNEMRVGIVYKINYSKKCDEVFKCVAKNGLYATLESEDKPGSTSWSINDRIVSLYDIEEFNIENYPEYYI